MKRTAYRVVDGVSRVNGKPVPPNRRVSLTDAEARYDLDRSRIEKASVRRTKSTKAEASDE